MNQRAEELGCLDSHFVNPNGLPDQDHYTTAYDLAMIGRAFFANEMLCKITLTRRMEFPATEKLPLGKLENNHMQIIPGGTYAYEYLTGCKTGYTDDARSCLVSCAEKNGMRLICVVMHDEAPYQYEDTISLYEYGFSNFEKVNVSQSETKYNIDNTGLFYSGNDIFGSSQPFLSLDRDDFILLPKTVSFRDLDSVISYDTEDENQAAIIRYSYNGVDIGSVRVNFSAGAQQSDLFENLPETEIPDNSVLYVNMTVILITLGVIAGLILIWLLIRAVLKNYAFLGRRERQKKRRKRRRRSSDTFTFRD